ncbi:MAG: ABC transporter substrate-binding protein [Candidatus Paceibacterota bacterium]
MYRAHGSLLTETPTRGGEITEGIVGSPRFINPLLAITDADRDLTALVYSGLMKESATGTLIPELAESYEISEDKLTYTFTIRDTAVFHDGAPVTADDVVYTIQKAQDPSLRSPKRVNWEGVTVSKIDTKTVSFTLRQPYSPFIQNMTLGILPSHIWNTADIELFQFSQYNSEPIGSGPYKISRIHNDESGIPSLYELKAFEKYVLGEPYITKLIFRFYPNESTLLDAYTRGEIERISGVQPAQARILSGGGARVLQTPLPRVFGIFFNPTQAPLFSDDSVREAIDLALDRDRIVAEVLQGYGTGINGPLPPDILPSTTTASTTPTSENIIRAQELLDENDWEVNENGIRENDGVLLTFTISTSNIPELRTAAELVREMLGELNIEVAVQIFDPNELTQNIIRPRSYDALLFGEIIGRDRDLYAFWHSSQRHDPGYNIALYTSIPVDRALEELRTTVDKEREQELFTTINTVIKRDRPAVFLYTPDFIYIVDHDTKGMNIDNITVPSERFININEWYIYTERIWPFLIKEHQL